MHQNKQSTEYAAFNRAKAIDEANAYEAISMGMGQVMGYHYKRLGYTSAKTMYNGLSTGQLQQINGMLKFINSIPNCSAAAKTNSKDAYTFAYYYNGSGNASTYSTKIKNAYKAITGKSL